MTVSSSRAMTRSSPEGRGRRRGCAVAGPQVRTSRRRGLTALAVADATWRSLARASAVGSHAESNAWRPEWVPGHRPWTGTRAHGEHPGDVGLAGYPRGLVRRQTASSEAAPRPDVSARAMLARLLRRALQHFQALHDAWPAQGCPPWGNNARLIQALTGGPCPVESTGHGALASVLEGEKRATHG